MKSNWTKEENEICSKYFIETYVISKRSISLSTAAKELCLLLSARGLSTLKMKLCNCKVLSNEMELMDSAPFAALENASVAHRNAFRTTAHLLGY